MKPILRFLIIVAIIVVSTASWVAPSLADLTPLPHPEHSPLLKSDVPGLTLQRIQSIRPGMTRGDLLQVFTEEGGISTICDQEYVYGVPSLVPGLSQDLLKLGPNEKLTPKTELLPSLQFSTPLRPMFINEQCIKVRVKFEPRAALLPSLGQPNINLSPNEPAQEQLSDIIVSISEPYWGYFVRD